MAIGLVSEEDFLVELGQKKSVPKDTHLPKTEVVPLERPGRKEGDTNVPESLRKIIGETSVIDGRQEALRLAADFGISASSVSAYAAGATSTTTYKTPSKEILSHINKSRGRAIKRSSRVLNAALGAITQEKLDYTDAKDLSIIAKNMSAVIKDLEPPQSQTSEVDAKQPPQFVIFAPTFRDERSFDSITVQE